MSMKVRFEEPKYGWIGFCIEEKNEIIINTYFSYICGCSLSSLLECLQSLKEPKNLEEKVIFYLEPASYEFIFTKEKENISLKILFFENHTRSLLEDEDIKLFKVGSYKEICMPFFRALRELQSHYSQEELDTLWKVSFSYEKLDKFSKFLKRNKS